MLSKTKIDHLGDRLRKGDISEDDLCLLDEYRRSFGETYKNTVDIICDELNLFPTGRPAKSTGAIVDKLKRDSIRLSQIQDIAGCRVVAVDIIEQDKIVAVLKKRFPDSTIVDRRKKPSFGYRAVHVIIKFEGKPVEVQVRSELQHLWAELSEKLSDVIDPRVKYGGGVNAVRELLASSSGLVAEYENIEKRMSLFIEKQANSDVNTVTEMKKFLVAKKKLIKGLLLETMLIVKKEG